MSFLTLEDINSAKYNNQRFWWYEIDVSKITDDPLEEFTNVKYDCFEISKELLSNQMYDYVFHIKFDTENWTKGWYHYGNTSYFTNGKLHIETNDSLPKLRIYMGNLAVTDSSNAILFYKFKDGDELSLNYKELNTPQNIRIVFTRNGGNVGTTQQLLTKGYNLIYYTNSTQTSDVVGYLLVNLNKTDFQFNCSQSLTVGKVNKVLLGTGTDYKPNGDLVGSYSTELSVIYDGKIIPVEWSQSDNDYVFNLDLTDKTETSTIRFKVKVEANDILNESITDVELVSQYETINTLAKLQTLFNNGGIGRLGSNLTLSADMTISKDTYLIGNTKRLSMQGHQFIVSENTSFKIENALLTGGENTIHQKEGSNVELNNCRLSNATGIGSVIECDIDISALENPTDFTTTLTNCEFSDNTMCILHSGDLTVTNCTVTGYIPHLESVDNNYPFFVYQTDGNAVITKSQFSISGNKDYDVKFASCIFICGETAQINGLSHSELQNNNINQFLQTPISNQSTVDLTYYYNVIDDNIHLSSSNGYCHSVSGVDYVFKNNVQVERS